MGWKNFLKYCWKFLNSNFFIAGAITILLWILAPAYEHRYWQKRFELEQRKIREEKSYDLRYKAAEEFVTNSLKFVAYGFMIEECGQLLDNDPILKKEMFSRFLAYCDSYITASLQAAIAFSDNKEVLSELQGMNDLSSKSINQILSQEYFKYKNKEILRAILKSYGAMISALKGKEIDPKKINDWLGGATGGEIMVHDHLSYSGPGCVSNKRLRKYPVSQKAMAEITRKITKEKEDTGTENRQGQTSTIH